MFIYIHISEAYKVVGSHMEFSNILSVRYFSPTLPPRTTLQSLSPLKPLSPFCTIHSFRHLLQIFVQHFLWRRGLLYTKHCHIHWVALFAQGQKKTQDLIASTQNVSQEVSPFLEVTILVSLDPQRAVTCFGNIDCLTDIYVVYLV